jgi:hypothetical protein
MTLLGPSVLGLWIDVDPPREKDFNEWYTAEHLKERVDVPGFIRGRRWEAVRGAPKYFTSYETEGAEVLRRDVYITLLNNPTSGTSTMLPHVRNGIRTAYRVVAMAGETDGVGVVTLRFDAEAGAENDVLQRYATLVMPELMALSQVSSVVFCEAEPTATGILTTERKIGGASTPGARFFCMIELGAPPSLHDSTLATVLREDGPARLGTRTLIEGAYRLIQCYSRSNAQSRAVRFI